MLIDVKNLSFAYTGQPVLKDISFSAETGKLISVLGPNGVGKSTMFRCMMGFLKTYTGEILLDGRNIRTLARRDMARLIAYIPQSCEPVFNYTLRDMVLMGTTGSMGLLERPKREHIEMAENVLDELGIGHLKERGIARVSGGERQLTLIGRAIVQQARILVMDEPTANLDYGNKHRVMKKIYSLAEQGYTVLWSTHDPEQALRFATDVLALRDGRLCAYGSRDEVLTAELLNELYDIHVISVETEAGNRKVRTFIPE